VGWHAMVKEMSILDEALTGCAGTGAARLRAANCKTSITAFEIQTIP